MLYFRLIYSPENPDGFQIDSNIKAEFYEEVLSGFLQTQIGQGEDPSPSSDLDEYHIEIKLSMTDDTYYSKSDTGNMGLTAGIIMDVMNRLPKGDN